MFGTVPPANADSAKLIAAIRNQTEGMPPHYVYVIDIVSVKFGGFFTADVKAELQKYRYLQMLTLNDCGIVSLQNFPNLPALIRLDMVFNEIPGEHLQFITNSRHLQTIMLGANKVDKIQHLNSLSGMRKLLQLDLINNPVSKIAGYRNQVFTIFPSLTILDTLDKIGKDAYSSNTMKEAVSRVPDNLFDKSVPVFIPPPPPPPVHAPIVKKQTSKLKKALKRAGSLDSMGGVSSIAVAPTKKTSMLPRKNAKGKMSSKLGSVRSRSARAGLIFPVGRVKRKLGQVMVGQRVGMGSSIYMSAILEYLTAEIVEIAGNEAKRNGKKRITPIAIKNALKGDEDMNKLLQNVTISMLE